MRGSITCFLFSPEVTHDIKCRHLILALSAADVANEAPGTFRTRAFWAHLLRCVYWSGLCSSWAAPVPLCPGWELKALGRGRGCQGGWGAASGRWRSRAHRHHCYVHTSRHPAPPRWHPFTAWRIILQRSAFLLLINRPGLIMFSPFCFYHHPLGLFSSSIKLSLAFIHLSHRWVKSCNYLQCVRREGVH